MKCPVYTVQLVRQKNVEYKRERCNSTQVAIRVIGQIVRPILENSPHEQFLIVSLDTKLKPIGVHLITTGTLDSSLVHPREVFRHAILANASSIILVHNHPSGDLEPSSQDRAVTDRLKRAGELIGIQIIDHLIFGVDDNDEFNGVSLAEC
jgi:DNA repair protein RadC